LVYWDNYFYADVWVPSIRRIIRLSNNEKSNIRKCKFRIKIAKKNPRNYKEIYKQLTKEKVEFKT